MHTRGAPQRCFSPCLVPLKLGAACCFAAEPAVLHISWLTQHSAVACVHVPRGAGSKIAFSHLVQPKKRIAYGTLIVNCTVDANAVRTTSAGSCWHEDLRNVCQVDKVRTHFVRHA